MAGTDKSDPGKDYHEKQKAAHKRRQQENISALKQENIIGSGAKTSRFSLTPKNIGIVAGALFVIVIAVWAMTPREGSTGFALCRVFLELNVRFPEELRYAEVIDLGSSVRIWYVQTDGFGAQRMEQIQCYFANGDPESGAFERIAIDRRDVDPRAVTDFNTSVPVILQQEDLDRTLPETLPDNVRSLRFDPGRGRKPVFGPR